MVKALICATVQPDKLRMPSGDSVWLPGFDGVIFNEEANRFVPTGLSVWELGTTGDPKEKAAKDYQKRSEPDVENDASAGGTHRLNRSQTTFVFVTPRVWPKKEDWVAERQAEGVWMDVRVIDGADLQDWLELTPAVSLQFAAELGLTPDHGLQTRDQAWEEWSHLTHPPASEELLRTGREEQEKEIIGRLIATPTTFSVRGDSPREAWGFVLAVLRQFEPAEMRSNLEARTIVAANEEVAARLQNLGNLVILLKQTKGQVSGVLSSRGCHVVVPEGNDGYSQRNVVQLTRPSHQPFVEALRRMGFSTDDAEQAARACGRSITILQRQHAPANVERPRWVDRSDAVNLIPALLAGRWSDTHEADRDILCRLAGVSEYAILEGQLQEFLLVDEPPLQKVGNLWSLTAPVDAFQLIARRMTSQHLDRFKEAFRDVFGKIDPKVDIPPDDWIYYDVRAEQSHSGWLRAGMAECLLLIAERGPGAKLFFVGSPRDYAASVIKGIPGLNEDWRVLASMRDYYPRLMEAAPRPLLDSLEELLEAKPNDVRRLFIEGDGMFGGGAMHTGLLWGLETLAWSPEYVHRVAVILTRLASLDAGGRMLNRPINSLREIFLWWHPGTNASFNQRLEAIDLVLSEQPQVGWTLLTKLLPEPVSSISHGTAKPRWRDFGDLREAGRDQRLYMSYIVDRTLDRVGIDVDRWREVLDSLAVMSEYQQEKALKLLEAIANEPPPEDVRIAFWEMLRDFVHRHQTFQDAEWAVTGTVITQVDAVAARLAPDDPVTRARWLFDEWLPDLPSGERDIDLRKQEATHLRHVAVSEIFQLRGIGGLTTLGLTCRYPGLVANATMSVMSNVGDVLSFAEQAITHGEEGVALAGHISAEALQQYGSEWRTLVRERANAGAWSSSVVASLLLFWPDNRSIWDELVGFDSEVAMAFWQRKPMFVIDGSADDQAYQIDRFIEAGRAAQALTCVAYHAAGIPSQTLLRLFDATLIELGRAETAADIRGTGLNSYHMRQFLSELRTREDVLGEELARREYQALPLLSLDVKGLMIHEFLAHDPSFFVDVLCDVFLPAHRDRSDEQPPTPETEARARVGYTLLQGMVRVPGQREDSEIDEQALGAWVDSVRNQAPHRDRMVIADQQIGKILAHSPMDPTDGAWPHQVVRRLIEKLGNESVDLGLKIERFNMRGTYRKDLDEGGAQERVLAQQYRDWAHALHGRWPRLTRLLDAIADDWEETARQEDVWAEQHKME